MEKDFIDVRELMSVKYYGIHARLNVIEVSGAVESDRYLYVITVRTSNHRDEVTEYFHDAKLSASKFRDIVSSLFFK